MADTGDRWTARFVRRLSQVPASDWDQLFASDYPFTRHAFLSGLERSGCVGTASGWEPCHLLLEDSAGALIGAAPLYLKAHSYGEFVFDFAWANASHRIGKPYYPKLLGGIPFVPSSGPRLAAVSPRVRERLATLIRQQCVQQDWPSAHVLFVDEAADQALECAGFLPRTDLQFQWHNRGYPDFAAFVACLTSEKRKKLLRERRRVVEAGIRFEHRHGDSLSGSEWQQVYGLYANTYEERGQPPYLNLEFLSEYGGACASPMRLILGYADHRLVCVALTLIGGDTLYGRHWGAAEHYHSLHFECCYYQGIELCLREGLQRYDAGTQGEHKLARGFAPVLTRSRHWLAEPRLSAAVEDYLQQERHRVAALRVQLGQHMPYRRDAESPSDSPG